ncbi:NrfD/PsrC family molybdoenzyme membrane anchor subunit [Sulfurospirillum sp. 1612]|uniref:NrfD/PsrC family molybdoenzyme membrane anchor subunit n=1 Tax=Sulfurospirillum sp. 1612 TaxID=3094835 RepID=UPI002F921BA0
MTREKMGNILVWILIIGFGAWGMPGIIDRFTNGHINTAYGSYIPWGLWISSYIWLIGLSAGALMISVMTYVFDIQAVKKVGKMAFLVAIATLVGAMISVGLDLGHPLRAFNLILDPNLHSMMGWMAILYTAYFITLCVELYLAIKKEQAQGAKQKSIKKILIVLGIWSIPLAFAFHGGVGGVFANVIAKPFWHGPMLPVVFLAGAFLSGGALFATVAYIWRPNQSQEEFSKMMIFLGKTTLALLILDEILEISEVYIGTFYAAFGEGHIWQEILFGPYWFTFWVVHILIGVLIPLFLLTVKSKSPGAIALAGLLIAGSFLAVRLNIVIPGMIDPGFQGIAEAWVHSKLTFSYLPSTMEWQVLFFIVAVVMAVFMIGKKLLPIYQVAGEE